MAYFNNPQDVQDEDYQSTFRQPVYDDYNQDSEPYDEPYEEPYDESYEDNYLDEQERWEARQTRWKVLAGAGDVLAVLAGAVVILVLIALLISLLTWVQADMSQSFTLWQTKL